MKPQNKLIAPKGKYRVIGVDTFEDPNTDYLIGDFDDKKTALEKAEEKGGEMNPTYVYDDKGRRIGRDFGSF